MKFLPLIGLIEIRALECPKGEVFRKATTEEYCDGTADKEILGKLSLLNRSNIFKLTYYILL